MSTAKTITTRIAAMIATTVSKLRRLSLIWSSFRSRGYSWGGGRDFFFVGVRVTIVRVLIFRTVQ